MLSRKWAKHRFPFLHSQEALDRQLPVSQTLSFTPTSLSLLPCPSYLDKREQRKENILSPRALPLEPALQYRPSPRPSRITEKTTVSESSTELRPAWFNLQGSGCVSSVGGQGSPALSSLPAPQLQSPGWQADRLLPELLHDRSKQLWKVDWRRDEHLATSERHIWAFEMGVQFSSCCRPQISKLRPTRGMKGFLPLLWSSLFLLSCLHLTSMW